MSEKENRALRYDNNRMYEESRKLLGKNRLEPLSVFSTEEHLQRTFDALRSDPNKLPVTYSSIGGGTTLIDEKRHMLEQTLARDTPNRAPRISALYDFFKIGYGLVERTVVDHHIYQAEPGATTPEAYSEWLERPQEQRVQEMQAYLKAQDAELLALNFLESEHGGTMLHFAMGLNISVPRVNGEAPYVAFASQDAEVRSQLKEGVLAAMYLLREHYVNQSMDDFDSNVKATFPPETPPGHYLG